MFCSLSGTDPSAWAGDHDLRLLAGWLPDGLSVLRDGAHFLLIFCSFSAFSCSFSCSFSAHFLHFILKFPWIDATKWS
jgi:hypothetical protein